MAAEPETLEMVPLSEFRESRGPDLLEKCRRFAAYVDRVRAAGLLQVQYRLELLSPLDHEIVVRDPFTGGTRRMTCFDSNSYLGLHLDPRVVGAARAALDAFGLGTPSAQILGGTNRLLIELEELLASYHGRPQALVFPSGYQANVGILTGLLRRGDRAFIDRFAHASLHDGCDYSHAGVFVFPHADVDALDRLFGATSGGLVVTDGLFSMHGDLAPLPRLREVATRHGALLMVDEAHSFGIVGPNGRGIEDHFGMEGSVDVLMGTFSKAPGAAGGYVVGDAALIEYLRYFSHGAMFTATLPAPTCAGLAAAVRILRDEPEHRERLWANTRRLWGALRAQQLPVPEQPSPILAVLVGDEQKLPHVAAGLFHAGIKAGIAQYPAVPLGECILRLTVNARHTEEELDRCAEVVGRLLRATGPG